jgi:hypothetical protein
MDEPQNDVQLTDAQVRILVALCRPLADGDQSATPATDQEIAAEVSLDAVAVEGLLRTLYGKFGIAGLPHGQRRARLAELATAGGYLSSEEGAAATGGTPAPAPVGIEDPAPRPTGVPLESVAGRARPDRAPAKAKSGHTVGEYVTVIIIIVVVIAGALAISGLFGQTTKTSPRPTVAAFRTEVAGVCREAIEGAPPSTGGGRAARARDYLEVIEAVRGNFEALPQPTLPSISLEHFATGLINAANYTGDIAKGPPPAGSVAEAKAVTGLNAAAAQVHAGAVGYKLGQNCVEVGDVVARSAQNAAAP